MATDHELVLYVMTGCPYCIKVKRFLADNGVTIPERNISTDPDAEQTLIAVGGKRQVPCLFIDGTPLYESSDMPVFCARRGAQSSIIASIVVS